MDPSARHPLCPVRILSRLGLRTGCRRQLDTLDNYTYYADVGYGFNPSLLANRWVERLHLFPVISVVYESLVLAIAATYAYLLGRRGLPIRVLALMVLTGLLGNAGLSFATCLRPGLPAGVAMLL